MLSRGRRHVSAWCLLTCATSLSKNLGKYYILFLVLTTFFLKTGTRQAGQTWDRHLYSLSLSPHSPPLPAFPASSHCLTYYLTLEKHGRKFWGQDRTPWHEAETGRHCSLPSLPRQEQETGDRDRDRMDRDMGGAAPPKAFLSHFSCLLRAHPLCLPPHLHLLHSLLSLLSPTSPCCWYIFGLFLALSASSSHTTFLTFDAFVLETGLGLHTALHAHTRDCFGQIGWGHYVSWHSRQQCVARHGQTACLDGWDHGRDCVTLYDTLSPISPTLSAHCTTSLPALSYLCCLLPASSCLPRPPPFPHPPYLPACPHPHCPYHLTTPFYPFAFSLLYCLCTYALPAPPHPMPTLPLFSLSLCTCTCTPACLHHLHCSLFTPCLPFCCACPSPLLCSLSLSSLPLSPTCLTCFM